MSSKKSNPVFRRLFATSEQERELRDGTKKLYKTYIQQNGFLDIMAAPATAAGARRDSNKPA
jgi:hypothetical protein